MTPSPVALLAAALLVGCGGNTQQTIPSDPGLERHVNAGRAALALDQPDQAVTHYRAALSRARERDDGTAIGDDPRLVLMNSS
jgi:hypothetical protein